MPEPTNVRELLQERVATNPGKTFLLSEADGREWTYAEFDSAVNRAANMLLTNGISKGDVAQFRRIPDRVFCMLEKRSTCRAGQFAFEARRDTGKLLKRELAKLYAATKDAKPDDAKARA